MAEEIDLMTFTENKTRLSHSSPLDGGNTLKAGLQPRIGKRELSLACRSMRASRNNRFPFQQ